MNATWLYQESRPKLLILFGGWGLGSTIFKDIDSPDYDCLFLEDYRDLSFKPERFENYAHYTILAYSFGVASALHWAKHHAWQPDRWVAVNGTPYPADDQYGIPKNRVLATAEQLTQASFAQFSRRCGIHTPCPKIDIRTRQAELYAILARGNAPIRQFDRLWICRQDRIIPPLAQEAAWASQSPKIRYKTAPHQPFAAGQYWEEWIE